MTVRIVEARELPVAAGGVAPLIVVRLSAGSPDTAEVHAARDAVASTPRIVIGRSQGPPHPGWQPLIAELSCTLVEDTAAADLPRECVAVDDVDGAIGDLATNVSTSPIAAVMANQLLRLTPSLAIPDALVTESLAYSALLAGPEFQAWLSRRPIPAQPTDEPEPVHLERRGARLTVTLNRPARHNAYTARMRDALVEALDLARHDASITSVVLRGAGRSFCSGGDIDEFGTTPDPATAHVIRTTRSVAALLAELSPRVEAQVHGACIGAGIEFAAFCGTVVAADDAFFQLPELGMGLVPGAGGTVSVSRRIGRWRTAYLVLTGRRIDVGTALAWNLVDRRADV